MSNRERSYKVEGQLLFLGGVLSFPSRHSVNILAFSTFVANEYQEHKLVAIGAYSFATAVSLSRIAGQHHFPSDTLVGAAVGHLVGKYIFHRRGRREIRVIREIRGRGLHGLRGSVLLRRARS